MNIKALSVEQLVEYVNKELLNGRSMVDIEINDFGVNDRVIVKRLTRRGYKRVGNEFTKDITKVIQKDNKANVKALKEELVVREKSVIQKHNKRIEEDKLNELVELIEPIKEMLQEYNRSKNIIDVNLVELKPKAVLEVKQKLFKIDVDVLDQWEEFVSKHKEYKVQQLISLALEEFIQKYK